MKRFGLIMMLLCSLLVGCKPEAEIPTVVINEVSDVTIDSAKVICNVTDDGGADVTLRGVCWNTSENPTINDSKTEDGSGTGSFISQLSDLVPNTQYYVRAYAVNSAGISYGNQKSFTTLGEEGEGEDESEDEGEDENELLNNKTITVNGVSFTMVAVKSGTFNMGAQSSDPEGINYDEEAWERESPVHQVTLSDYYIGETEVTQELWQAVMGVNPSLFQGEQKPVEQITWYDCQGFIKGLNQLTGLNFRLPTEAEWEFAARGGVESQGYKYSGGDNIDDVAWYSVNSKKKSKEVKTKLPNELGIYDMCGNVMEWCQDIFGDYSGDPQIDPVGALSGTDCIVRGGCCLSDEGYCRVTIRSFFYPGGASYGIGFRLALDN